MNLAGTKKIIVPKNTIISTVKLKKKIDGKKKIEGHIKAKDEENVTLVTKKDKKEVVISRNDIKKIRWGYKKPKVKSSMPGNFRDLLSVQNLQDIMANLKSIDPVEPTKAAQKESKPDASAVVLDKAELEVLAAAPKAKKLEKLSEDQIFELMDEMGAAADNGLLTPLALEINEAILNEELILRNKTGTGQDNRTFWISD